MIRIMKSLDFYAFTGIGGLSYSIEPNEKLSEHGLDTKGFTAVVPLGLGGNISAYPNVKFGLELGFRYAFTDNIDGKLNPNTATVYELAELPGLGPGKAQAIVEYRQEEVFKSAGDIEKSAQK